MMPILFIQEEFLVVELQPVLAQLKNGLSLLPIIFLEYSWVFLGHKTKILKSNDFRILDISRGDRVRTPALFL